LVVHPKTGAQLDPVTCQVIYDTTHIGLYNEFSLEFEEIYGAINSLLEKLAKNKRQADFHPLYKITSEFERRSKFSFNYCGAILTVGLLGTFRQSARRHWYNLNLEEFCEIDLEKTHTLIEIIQIYTETVLANYKLLYCLGLVDEIPLETTLHKYTHVIIRDLIDRFPGKYITAGVIDKQSLSIQPANLGVPASLELLVEAAGLDLSPDGPASAKIITYVVFQIKLPKQTITRFGIYQKAKEVISKHNVHLTVADFLLYCREFIHQKTNKPETVINKMFIQRVSGLFATKFYPDQPMIATVTKCVVEELDALRDELLGLLPKSVENPNHIQAAGKLLEARFKKYLMLRELNKGKLKQYRSIKKLAYNVGKLPIQPLSLAKVTQEIFSSQSDLGDLAIFVLQFQSLTTLAKHSESTVKALQERLVRLYYLKEYLEFTNQLTSMFAGGFYFSYYIDFRGRIYYDSQCSPQSY
jgi:hypothetical protein